MVPAALTLTHYPGEGTPPPTHPCPSTNRASRGGCPGGGGPPLRGSGPSNMWGVAALREAMPKVCGVLVEWRHGSPLDPCRRCSSEACNRPVDERRRACVARVDRPFSRSVGWREMVV